MCDHPRCSVGKRGTIEVAHEALLRTWPELKSWLVEDRPAGLYEFLLRSAAEWDERGRQEDALVHRDGRLILVMR